MGIRPWEIGRLQYVQLIRACADIDTWEHRHDDLDDEG